MFMRIARAAVLASALVAVTAGAAFAHECYNASRSVQGSSAATHSANWWTASVAGLFEEIHLFGIPGVETPLTPAQAEVAFEAALEMGVPETVTIFVGRHTIGANGAAFSEKGKATDGKGIDHFFATHGDAVITAYFIGLASGD